jgi:hypothetical protein
MSASRWCVLSCALAVIACKQEPVRERSVDPALPAAQREVSVAPPAQAGPTAPGPTADVAVLARVAVPADFEEQAAAEITPENLDDELTRLERETTE